MQKITVDYLMRLGACWNRAKLEAAAKLWPSDPTWAWFLGSRLAEMNRAEQLERVHVALAHVGFQRITLPTAPGQIAAVCKNCGQTELLAVCEALGQTLDVDSDAPLEAHAASFEELQSALIAAKHSGVIEAKP